MYPGASVLPGVPVDDGDGISVGAVLVVQQIRELRHVAGGEPARPNGKMRSQQLGFARSHANATGNRFSRGKAHLAVGVLYENPC